jgi:DtxR family transcriptional regulator, Mn-dependent transcriptional regulator
MSPLSHAVEDYLKVIYELQEDMGKVSTNALAEKLGVKAGSVTGMISKLAEEQPRLVDYEKHKGVTLTDAGRKIALEVIRHHRLIELYLHQALGYKWDEVHAEAEKLEHVISEDFEDRIAAVLGQPERDPHGDPIPRKDGTLPEPCGQPLTRLTSGQAGRVARVRDNDPALLRYLGEIGIVPDAKIVVTDKSPFDGPLHVRVGKKTSSPAHALGKLVTDQIFVEVEEA